MEQCIIAYYYNFIENKWICYDCQKNIDNQGHRCIKRKQSLENKQCKNGIILI